MYHEMKVSGFAADPLTPKPVVLLKGGNDLTVPIWISTAEAVSMAAELVSRDIATHSGRDDLLSALLEQLQMTISSIVIDSLHDGMVTAAVHFAKDGEVVKVGVRTCEALIASLKFKLPVLVSEDVVMRVSHTAMGDEIICHGNDTRRFADFLENLDPADLGRYPM